MNPILRNVLAIVAGVIVGGVINMGIIMLSGSIVPLPEGVEPGNIESLKANMHLFKPVNFIFPFLAHAVGTLAGAYTTARLAVNNKVKLALIIGAFFLLGGIKVAMDLPAPAWFNTLDILIAYLPMAWIGAKLGER